MSRHPAPRHSDDIAPVARLPDAGRIAEQGLVEDGLLPDVERVRHVVRGAEPDLEERHHRRHRAYEVEPAATVQSGQMLLLPSSTEARGRQFAGHARRAAHAAT